MQTGAPLVRLPRARQPSTSRACCYSPVPPAQRKLLTPKALGRREKTQALNRPPIRGRSIDSGSAQLLYAQPLTGFDAQGVEITEAGDLVLSDPCCDGFVYEWRREQ